MRFAPILAGWLVLACGERSDWEPPRLPQGKVRASVVSLTRPPAVAARRARASLSAEPSLPLSLPARVVFAVGGDVNFGRECGQELIKDPDYDPFTGLGPAWRAADARFVNLESQLSDQDGVTQSPGNRLVFTGPPQGAASLRKAGITVVSTANNHAWDYGKNALLETIVNLEHAGVSFAGTGRDAEQAYRPALLQIGGLRLALFAVTHIWNQGAFHEHEGKGYVAWADVERLRAGIEQAKRAHDFVFVSYHGGEEYIDAPVDRTRRFVKAIMALGVDAFIGHHPHVPQGVGWVDERPVLYSLGNLVFAGHENRPWTKQSFFARLTLERGKPPQVSACPYAIEGHRPSVLPSSALATARFRSHLALTSTSVGGSTVEGPDEFGCLPVTPRRPRAPLPTGPGSPPPAAR